jgi:hypothetical protein
MLADCMLRSYMKKDSGMQHRKKKNKKDLIALNMKKNKQDLIALNMKKNKQGLIVLHTDMEQIQVLLKLLRNSLQMVDYFH